MLKRICLYELVIARVHTMSWFFHVSAVEDANSHTFHFQLIVGELWLAHKIPKDREVLSRASPSSTCSVYAT